jgi:cyclophilin family peptidyl-prolyl cis-trans isomerase
MKYILAILILVSACTSNNEVNLNNFSDEKLVNIYQLQDQRDVQGLIPFLKAKKQEHRIAAALAFASIKDTLAIPYLSQMLQIDQDELPRRAAAQALGQIGHVKALKVLKPAFDSELSKHNQKVILEAIGKCGDSSTLILFEDNAYTDSLLQIGWAYGVFRLSFNGHATVKLRDRMMNVLIGKSSDIEKELASHYLLRFFSREEELDTSIVKTLIHSSEAKHIKDRLGLLIYEKENTMEEFNRSWISQYNTLNSYDRALKILNISEGDAKAFLSKIALNDTNPSIIRNAAYEKFMSLNAAGKWPMVLKGLQSNDMALQSLACYEIHKIRGPKHVPELMLVWTDLWDECKKIKQSLSLPEQAETYIDVCKAIEALGGEKYKRYQPEFNHPIDWEFTKTIPHNQAVRITTTQGIIDLECFVNEAPGTVTNFIKLVDSGYYNNKYFHRVVPQFVIQGGCPRGDGWGSLDWTQRSEFSNYQVYSEGTVGIASSGLDTEGVQIFITHCSTPYLDGRYTIFARVTKGMDIVNSVSVGDKIISIERI